MTGLWLEVDIFRTSLAFHHHTFTRTYLPNRIPPSDKLPLSFMANPLSISTSVAGLLSLVIQVADGTYQYVSGARSASSTISSLLRELRALKTVLVRLDDLTHSSYTEAGGDVSIISQRDIEVCRKICRSFIGSLTASSMRKARRRLCIVWLGLFLMIRPYKWLQGFTDMSKSSI